SPGPTLVITIPPTGDVIIAGQPVPDARLDALLRAAAVNKATELTLVISKGVAPGRVTPVMTRAKQAGITRIEVTTAP
ncbi:MAG: Biopolymer transport protein ExbD/TolR, partial [Deltaproteobacteria bacterium]|nr:Biopolymer transport protein ExbD/TolR [Deltaproteobacteria bacterium]